MTFAFQGTLILEGSKITQCVPKPGSVSLRINHKTIEFPNCWAIPGLVDAHAHVIGLGLFEREGYLIEAQSKEECIHRIIHTPYRRGEWIVGRGWNQELWQEARFPSCTDLDHYFPTTPVALTRVDGHALWVNSCALERAGISATTPDPIGGSIIRDEQGNPKGILIDSAMEQVKKLIPQPSNDELAQAIRTALTLCSSAGLTEIHDMDVDPTHIPIFLQLAQEGALQCRICCWVRGQNEEWHTSDIKPLVSDLFSICGIKLFADGALGSRGAALLEPYSDDVSNIGLLLLSASEITSRAKLAISDGFRSIAVHAIGDRAVRTVLDAYTCIRNESSEELLLRIEHSQIVHPDDLDRYAQTRTIASVQPIHCISDAHMAVRRLETRVSCAYPWKSFFERGVIVCAGSDFPIESHNPLTGIYAFCQRKPPGWNSSWHPHERISRLQALQAYTINAHRASGMHQRRGILAPTMDADLVIVDRNIESCSDVELLQTRIIATVVGSTLYHHA